MVTSPAPSVRHHKRTPAKSKRVPHANRRRVNLPRRILIVAVVLLFLECVAVVLYSPRFYLTRLETTGLETLTRAQIQREVFWGTTQNLFLAPTKDWERRVARIPSVDSVSVQRILPGTIRVVVHERKPWATVRTSDGLWHTLDTHFIPFRLTKSPEDGLPRILVSDLAAWEALPGVRLPSRGIDAAGTCLAWANAHPDFPITQIEIDRGSKVYLSRAGQVSVQLGAGEKLLEKLASLERLVAARPELRTSTDIKYINLFAPDAPAIGLRKPLPQKRP